MIELRTRMKKYRPTQQYLLIDITQEKWSVHQLSQDVHGKYLGGNPLALYLYDLYCNEYGESYETEPLVFAPSLFSQMNIFNASSISIAGRSPFSNEVRVTQSNALFSTFICSCGFNAVVLVGSSRRTISVEICEHSVSFHPNEKLYGKSVSESLAQLDLAKDKTALLIGPSAERKVAFSSIISNYRGIEREGFGAVMGSKRVKALIVQRGDYLYESMDQQSLNSHYSGIQKSIASSSFFSLQKKEFNLAPARFALENGYAGVAHCTRRRDPRGIHLQGSFHPEFYQTEGYENWEAGVRDTANKLVPMDSSTMLAFGSNIKNYNPGIAAFYTFHCIDMGLEPVSTAAVISWVMEARQRGVMNDIPISYSDFSHITEAISNIASNTDYGQLLAKGTAHLARYYNDGQFILSIRNKEMLPFDPRGAYGQGLVQSLGYDFYFAPELLSRKVPSKKIRGTGEAVLHSEILFHLGGMLGLHSLSLGAYLCSNTFGLSPIRKRKTSMLLKSLAEITSEFTGDVCDERTLLQSARSAIILEQNINKKGREDDASLPLQFLINGESSLDDDSTVPITKLLQEYTLKKELLGLRL
ncbi:MAG: aldehyde ferredoxin oxidoreductase N-terminal domain-containing protein [Spirochaetaceae bacterium JB067]